MIDTICATKKGMSQIWDAAGKRIAVTKFLVEPNIVVGEVNAQIKTDKKSTSSAVISELSTRQYKNRQYQYFIQSKNLKKKIKNLRKNA